MQRNYAVRDEGGCCWSLCRCLARVPCSSFCVFLTLVAALVSFVGSLLVAFYRTRVIIEQPEIWPWFLYACIGVAVGMLLFAGAYLAVASVSATLAYATDKQNLCLRVVNYIIMLLGIVLQLAWIMVTLIASAAVLILLLFFNQCKTQNRINLSHYGIPKPVMVGEELTSFREEVEKAELLICYSTSLVCSAIVTATLTVVLINTAYNYATLNVGKRKDGSCGNSRPSSHLIAAYNDGPKSSETVL